MKTNSLKIIIFDGSFSTTPFINRLALGLSKKHAVYIVGFNEEVIKKLPNIHYIGVGSNSNQLKFIKTTFKLAFQTRNFKLLLKTFKMFFKQQRKELQQQNINIAIQQIQPDIIHLQWPSVLPWFEKVLNKQEIPVVLSQRGYHSNVRPFVNSENFEYLKQWYPKLAGFHSVSNAISNKGNTIYNSPKKINQVVYTGLDMNNILFNEMCNKPIILKIISVGRAHWIKGYDYALKACAILKEKGVLFTYTIIGVTNNEELLYLRKKLNLIEEVKFLEKLPQKNVYKLMQEAHLLVLPSIEEGIANVVVEAMALGCPVISTNCGGMTELITHKKEGWIVATRDSDALAKEISNFKQLDIAVIEEVKLNARKKVAELFSEEKMIADMEKLYYTPIIPSRG